jgi:hypothetical protein
MEFYSPGTTCKQGAPNPVGRAYGDEAHATATRRKPSTLTEINCDGLKMVEAGELHCLWGLKARKLLILRNAKNAKNPQIAKLGFTAGTRGVASLVSSTRSTDRTARGKNSVRLLGAWQLSFYETV